MMYVNYYVGCLIKINKKYFQQHLFDKLDFFLYILRIINEKSHLIIQVSIYNI